MATTRSEQFNDKMFTMKEKISLYKQIQVILHNKEDIHTKSEHITQYTKYEKKPFIEQCNEQKISLKIIDLFFKIFLGFLTISDTMLCEEIYERQKLTLIEKEMSKSPCKYIYPCYGVCDQVQSLIHSIYVYDGICIPYTLPLCWVYKDSKFYGILLKNGQFIKINIALSEPRFISKELNLKEKPINKKIIRLILLHNIKSDNNKLQYFPSLNSRSIVLGKNTNMCPSNYTIEHLILKYDDTTIKNKQHIYDYLKDIYNDTLVYSILFMHTMQSFNSINNISSLYYNSIELSNIFVIQPPNLEELDLTQSLEIAKNVYYYILCNTNLLSNYKKDSDFMPSRVILSDVHEISQESGVDDLDALLYEKENNI